MNGKGQSHPLIFLYTAVIMCVKVGKGVIDVLKQGILLHIQPGAVNVSTQNVHALRQRLFPHLEHDDGLVHPHAVYLIASLQSLPALDQGLQLPIPFRLNGIYDDIHTFPLRLAVIQKLPVLHTQIFQLLLLLFIIIFPSTFF